MGFFFGAPDVNVRVYGVYECFNICLVPVAYGWHFVHFFRLLRGSWFEKRT